METKKIKKKNPKKEFATIELDEERFKKNEQKEFHVDLLNQLPMTVVVRGQYDGLRQEQDKFIQKMQELSRIVDVAEIAGGNHTAYLDFTCASNLLVEQETIKIWNRTVNQSCLKPEVAHSKQLFAIPANAFQVNGK